MKNTNRALYILLIICIAVLLPTAAFADSPLYVSEGDVSGFRVYDMQGKPIAVDTMLTQGLYEGTILRTGAEPVALGSPAGTVVMQPDTIMGVSRLSLQDPVLYLVTGTAFFQIDEAFSGMLSISTPVSRYQISGPGKVWVSSDIGELVYAFEGQVSAFNIITKQRTQVPSAHYLDMMTPFMEPKPISRQAYMSMAYDPDTTFAATLPMATPDIPAFATTTAQKMTFQIPEQPEEPVAKPQEPTFASTKMEPQVPQVPAVLLFPETPAAGEATAAPAIPRIPTFSVVTSDFLAPAEPQAPACLSSVVSPSEMPAAVPASPKFSETPVAERIVHIPMKAETSVEIPAKALVPQAPAFTPTRISYYRQPKAETIPSVVAPQNPQPTQPDDKLTIRQPSGVVSGAQPEKSKFQGGVALSYRLHYNGSPITVEPLSTLAVRPYLTYGTMRLGLQATVGTTGSLAWDDLTGTVKFDTSSPLSIAASVARFIEYFRIGTTSGRFNLNADTTSPLTFGINSMMGGLDHRFSDTDELSLYTQVNTASYGHQLYFDDLYLQGLLEGGTQSGGIRFRFTPLKSYPFSVAASSLVVLSKTSGTFVADLYPGIDLSFPLVNTRKLRLNLNVGGALYMQAAPDFDITDVFDADGADFSAKFPNLLASAGIEASFSSVRIGATLAFNHGKAVSNLINDTRFSGTPMTSGDVLDFMIDGSYSVGALKIDGSWNVPFSMAGPFGIADLAGDTNGRKADVSSLTLSYSGKKWSFGAGIQQIDMIGSYRSLFASGASFSTRVASFLDPDYTDIFGYAAYDTGAVRLDAKLSTASETNGQTSLGFSPVIDMGMTVRFDSDSIAKFGKTESGTESGQVAVSGNVGVMYMNRRFSATPSPADSNDQVLMLSPTIQLDTDNFSLGLGIEVGFSLGYNTFLDRMSWYRPRGDWQYDFGFLGNNGMSTFWKAFDMATDLFNLVEHFTFGTAQSSFMIRMDRTTALTFSGGALVNDILPAVESPYFSALTLYNSLSTKYFGYELFVDDMTCPTLAGLAVMGRPTAGTYPFGIGVSAVLQAEQKLYEMRLYPAVDMVFPIMDDMSFEAHVATAARFSDTDGNAFLLLDSNGSLRNYLVSGAMNGRFGGFGLSAAVGIQSGMLSYGMFDEFYIRNSRSILGDETAASTLFGDIGAQYDGGGLSVRTGYLAAFDLTGFSGIDSIQDKFDLQLTYLGSKIDISAGFVKRDLLSALNSFSGSGAPLLTTLKGFFISDDAILYGQLDVKAGNATLSGRISTTQAYEMNGNATGTIKPTIAMGATIEL